MLDINVVFPYLGPADAYALQRGDARVTWSPAPLPDSDLYAYMTAASFFGRLPGPQVLIQAEPVVTQPGEYHAEVYHHFDHVLTMLDCLDGVTPSISRWQPPPWDLRAHPGGMPDLAALRELYPREGRSDAICMINGNKTSAVPGELYTARASIARWFSDHSSMPFDVYGTPPFEDLPNFIRVLDPGEKLSVLASYRYRLCLENCYDPFWSLGYITEKLPECLACGTVPIYYGCANIEEYLPAGCFIDYRELGTPERLDEYLHDVSDADYHAYLDSIDAWLGDGHLRGYCQSRLYDKLTELLAESIGGDARLIWGADTEWAHADTPPALPERGGDTDGDGSAPTGHGRNTVPYWSWEYLERATLQDCTDSVAAMKRTRSLGTAPHDRPTPRAEKSREVRRLLYLGVGCSYGDQPGEVDFSARNLLMDWDTWPGIEVQHIDPGVRAMQEGVAGMSEGVLREVVDGGFDLVFCVPYSIGLDVLHDAMRRITLHTNTLVWTPHTPQRFATHSLAWADCADRVVTTSELDLRAFAEAGHADRALLSRWAFSPRTYGRGRATRRRIVTLVGPRNVLSQEMCQLLASHDIAVAAHGRGWGEDRFLPHALFQRSLRESAINLNLGGRRRVYETTGSGGFLMTTLLEGLDDAFVTDVADPSRAEVVVVGSAGELLEKARYYLDHAEEREAIARRGYERAHRDHTWTHRFADVCARAGWTLPDPDA